MNGVQKSRYAARTASCPGLLVGSRGTGSDLAQVGCDLGWVGNVDKEATVPDPELPIARADKGNDDLDVDVDVLGSGCRRTVIDAAAGEDPVCPAVPHAEAIAQPVRGADGYRRASAEGRPNSGSV